MICMTDDIYDDVHTRASSLSARVPSCVILARGCLRFRLQTRAVSWCSLWPAVVSTSNSLRDSLGLRLCLHVKLTVARWLFLLQKARRLARALFVSSSNYDTCSPYGVSSSNSLCGVLDLRWSPLQAHGGTWLTCAVSASKPRCLVLGLVCLHSKCTVTCACLRSLSTSHVKHIVSS